MKPTKIRNKKNYFASTFTKSIQVGGTLSSDLREKLGKRKVRVAKGDSVKVLRGEYKGVEGKVTKISTEKTGVAIEGIKKEKLKGEKIDIYIDSSNIQITGLNTDDNWRKFRLEGKNPKLTPKEQKITEEPKEKLEEKIIETKEQQKKPITPEEKKESRD
jgi:large subunit ribosomal protein L24